MHDIPYEVDTYRLKPDASRVIGIAILNRNLVAPAVRTMYNHIVENYKQEEFYKERKLP